MKMSLITIYSWPNKNYLVENKNGKESILEALRIQMLLQQLIRGKNKFWKEIETL